MDEDSEHRRDSVSHGGDGDGRAPLYAIPSNRSTSSIFEDVEMAQNEVCRTLYGCIGLARLILTPYISSLLVPWQKASPPASRPFLIGGHAQTHSLASLITRMKMKSWTHLTARPRLKNLTLRAMPMISIGRACSPSKRISQTTSLIIVGPRRSLGAPLTPACFATTVSRLLAPREQIRGSAKRRIW